MTGRNKIQRFGFGSLRATVAFTIVNWCCVLVAHASILRLNDTSGLPFRFMEAGGIVGIRRLLWLDQPCDGSGGSESAGGVVAKIGLSVPRLL